MEKIILSENHRRSVTSSLKIVEELLNEIENVLNHPANGFLSKMTVDISKQNKKDPFENIKKARQWIQKLFIKYGLSVQYSLMSRFIDSRKSKIWEIQCDTTSKRLKGYGEFQQKNSIEFDEDINQLQALVKQI